MDDKLVTLKSFTTPAEAHLVRTKLEDNGVPAFVFDENMVGINPFFSNAIGGVKVKIPESYSDEALKILNLSEEIESEDDKHCPKCQSNNTEYLKLNWLFTIIVSLFFFFPIPYLKRKWECKDCGFKWKSGNNLSQ